MSKMASDDKSDPSAGSQDVISTKSKTLKLRTRTQGIQLVSLLLKSAKTAGLLLAVWSVGWMKFSVSWVLGAVIVYIGGREYTRARLRKRELARLLAEDEEETILARVDELPSWVYFPDVERAEWLNKMIQQMWPFIGDYVKKVLHSKVEGVVDGALPTQLKPFKFEDINFGKMPPRVGGVKVYIDNVTRNEIVLDVELSYAGDSDINVSLRGLHAGIKDLLIHGTVRVIMRPLINVIPIIGGLEICFISQPSIDFDLTNIANILDMPLLSSSLRTVVSDQIANFLVLPNKINVPLADLASILMDKKFAFQMPKGVVRLVVVEGADLKRADFKLIGKGKSDPYTVVKVGGNTFTTDVLESTIQPHWDQSFEFTVDQANSVVDFEVFDKDPGPGKDDKLGRAYLDLGRLIATGGKIDEWLTLTDVDTGRLHIRCSYLYLNNNPNDPTRVKALKTAESPLSSAMLFVVVDSAKNLPKRGQASKKAMVEPSPFVSLEIGNKKFKTDPRMKTTNPKWEERFEFFVTDPESQDLIVDVLDSSKDNKKLGSLKFKLVELLSEDDMRLDQPFALKEAVSDCTLRMRLCLRVLSTSPPEEDDDDNATKSSQASHNGGGAGGGGDSAVVVDSVNCSRSSSISMTENAGPRFRGPIVPSNGKFGRIQLTLRYSSQRAVFIVVVLKCENLIICDKDNFSDPYVRLYLLPDRTSASKRKTQTIKNNLNPTFDETFEWPLAKKDVASKTLEVTVKNFIGVFEKRTRSEMGIIQLKLEEFEDLSKVTTEWYDLQDPDVAYKTSDSHAKKS